ncbi:hypothetical protein K7X08_016339 [Anisodus acutangulus]|uniref:DUF4378 domain-containing protein n=1 Tax=Anisodus acutangulus TaxID=402998 RepID=A0A9Q1LDZ8_9SOLA|nr:hypothetical protein K7X08_016339 [Anisodus acutangulus]
METNEAQESRKVAKTITQHMRVNIGGHQGDETLLSSVFANGYIGDESSFNKSEKEYADENLSDSEVMSPASRHSWEYGNRCRSPYSCSSLSRASYSPESSISREAKKRLSERWEMVVSNGSCQEQRQMRRSNSNTLSEMLDLSDIKTTGRIEQDSIKEDSHISNFNSVSNSKDDEGINKSPKNLLRSKFVPVSSTVYSSQLNVGAPDSVTGKNDLPKQITKPRSTKSSLKRKVSNLFSSRNKKPNKDRAKCLQSNDKLQSGTKSLRSLSKVDKYSGEFFDDPGVECSTTNLRQYLVGKQGATSPEVVLFGARSLRVGHPCENQKHPSFISVLETPFEEDERLTRISSGGIEPDRHAQSDAFSTMWHSAKSPLNPSLREKYIDMNENETLHETKRRQRRSTQKLVFDCVNAALLEIAGHGPDNYERAIPSMGVHNNLPQKTRLVFAAQMESFLPAAKKQERERRKNLVTGQLNNSFDYSCNEII